MLAPINSIKHYVHQSNQPIASGAIINIEVADAVIAPATAAASEVHEGSVLKAIYIELWIGGDGSSGLESTFTAIVEKKRDLEPDATFANLTNLGAYPNKKNILYTTQGIVPAMLDGGMTIPIIRGWFKIPKGKQRFGLDDQFMVSVSSVDNMRICGFFTYKEYN